MASQIVSNGTPLNHTVENKGYKTNVNEGFPHLIGQTHKGSVTQRPIYDGGTGDNSLWLEHVIHKSSGNKCFWFMWYDPNGIPQMPGSSVIDEDSIMEVVRNISRIEFP